jgi:cell volume regulation protein A
VTPVEPLSTSIVLAIVGALLLGGALFSRATERVGVPVLLAFLGLGMLAGSEGLGRIAFEDYHLAYRLGTIALVFILFDGGFNTSASQVRRIAGPAAVLGTLGVIGTAGLLAIGARLLLHMDWEEAMLLGAIVSSTDAAAVFAVLRGRGVHLKEHVGATIEVESGANDPMAVILTTVVTEHMIAAQPPSIWQAAFSVVTQIAIGMALGLGIGYGGRALLARSRLSSNGLYAVVLIGIACLAFAVPTLIGGSGFLAVYVSAIVLGNGKLPLKRGLVRVHDALAWLGQVMMFVVMGLLVFPSRLIHVAGPGLLLAAFLAIVARPAVVWLCLLPFRSFRTREIAYIGWIGLRGAVPIILAAFPVLAGARGADRIFDLVFFVVVMSALLPGATVGPLARRLGLVSDEPPPPQAVLEIDSRQPLNGDLISFYVDEALPVAGERLVNVPFPPSAAVTLIVRGNELLAARGDTELLPGDHLYVFARDEDRATIQLLLGHPEQS